MYTDKDFIERVVGKTYSPQFRYIEQANLSEETVAIEIPKEVFYTLEEAIPDERRHLNAVELILISNQVCFIALADYFCNHGGSGENVHIEKFMKNIPSMVIRNMQMDFNLPLRGQRFEARYTLSPIPELQRKHIHVFDFSLNVEDRQFLKSTCYIMFRAYS